MEKKGNNRVERKKNREEREKRIKVISLASIEDQLLPKRKLTFETLLLRSKAPI